MNEAGKAEKNADAEQLKQVVGLSINYGGEGSMPQIGMFTQDKNGHLPSVLLNGSKKLLCADPDDFKLLIIPILRAITGQDFVPVYQTAPREVWHREDFQREHEPVKEQAE